MCIVCAQTIHKLYTNNAWSLPQPLPKGKGFVAALMHRTWGSFWERQRDKETKRGRVGGRKGKKNYGKAKENYGKAKKNYGKAKEKFEEGKEKFEEGKF